LLFNRDKKKYHNANTGRSRKEAEMSEIQKEIKITGLNIKM